MTSSWSDRTWGIVSFLADRRWSWAKQPVCALCQWALLPLTFPRVQSQRESQTLWIVCSANSCCPRFLCSWWKSQQSFFRRNELSWWILHLQFSLFPQANSFHRYLCHPGQEPCRLWTDDQRGRCWKPPQDSAALHNLCKICHKSTIVIVTRELILTNWILCVLSNTLKDYLSAVVVRAQPIQRTRGLWRRVFLSPSSTSKTSVHLFKYLALACQLCTQALPQWADCRIIYPWLDKGTSHREKSRRHRWSQSMSEGNTNAWRKYWLSDLDIFPLGIIRFQMVLCKRSTIAPRV